MTKSARVLVLGGYGCIGVQTVKWLLANTNATVVVGSREFRGCLKKMIARG
jgi:nucleoside-diphosphate-sugar epimerase